MTSAKAVSMVPGLAWVMAVETMSENVGDEEKRGKEVGKEDMSEGLRGGSTERQRSMRGDRSRTAEGGDTNGLDGRAGGASARFGITVGFLGLTVEDDPRRECLLRAG